ncbi:MAG TPA: GtrA family protein [Phenylobacterium sp.]
MSGAQARLLRFVLSGGLASLTFFALSWLFLELDWRPFVANLTAYALAFALGYAMQRTWTFEARHAHGHALPRYFIVQLSCAGMSAVLGEVGVTLLGLEPLVVSLATTVIAGAISYLASSLWVFPTPRA